MENRYPSNLISCPDCGRNVSRRAIMCPGCGCPVSEAIKEIRLTEQRQNIPQNFSIGPSVGPSVMLMFQWSDTVGISHYPRNTSVIVSVFDNCLTMKVGGRAPKEMVLHHLQITDICIANATQRISIFTGKSRAAEDEQTSEEKIREGTKGSEHSGPSDLLGGLSDMTGSALMALEIQYLDSYSEVSNFIVLSGESQEVTSLIVILKAMWSTKWKRNEL